MQMRGNTENHGENAEKHGERAEKHGERAEKHGERAERHRDIEGRVDRELREMGERGERDARPNNRWDNVLQAVLTPQTDVGGD